MPEPFEIDLTDGAQADLRWFVTYAQRIIIDGIDVHLDTNRLLAVARS